MAKLLEEPARGAVQQNFFFSLACPPALSHSALRCKTLVRVANVCQQLSHRMGLDAFVYCDCYEKGLLREPPPAGVTLCVEPDGLLGRVQTDTSLEADMEWDQWRSMRACKHEGGILLSHRLGNISLIGLLRNELQEHADTFPILVHKVLYSGSHTGDFLPADQIPALQHELDLLATFKCKSRESDKFVAQFREQMAELAATAQSINKPIAF
jgi:hypothetical protein